MNFGTKHSLINLNSGIRISNGNSFRKKIMIMVTGTDVEPYDKNWKECYSTWIPELKKLGYNVMVALGNPDIDNYYKISEDREFIYFKTSPLKKGLFFKSIYFPIKWILEETKFEYYLRVDSDSFVEPNKFDIMIKENLETVSNLDYMGCCHPYINWNPHQTFRKLIYKPRHFASGCAYFVSRKAMKIAYNTMRVENEGDLAIDDWVLGRSMWENGIPLLHDSRIIFESKYKPLAADPYNIGVPDISKKTSHLAIQHYMNGHMEEAMINLGYRN
jgi:hypothetical protein